MSSLAFWSRSLNRAWAPSLANSYTGPIHTNERLSSFSPRLVSFGRSLDTMGDSGAASLSPIAQAVIGSLQTLTGATRGMPESAAQPPDSKSSRTLRIVDLVRPHWESADRGAGGRAGRNAYGHSRAVAHQGVIVKCRGPARELGGVLLVLGGHGLRSFLYSIDKSNAGAHERQQVRGSHLSPALLRHREQLECHEQGLRA